jgi:hypothetical protein
MFWRVALWAAVLVVLVSPRPVRSGPIFVANPVAAAQNQEPESPFDPLGRVGDVLHFASHIAHPAHAIVPENAPSAWRPERVTIALQEEIPFNFRSAGALSLDEIATALKSPAVGGTISEVNAVFAAGTELGAGSRAAANCTRFTGGAAFASEASTVGTVSAAETLAGTLGKVGGAAGAGAGAAAAAAAAAKRKKE